MLGKIKTEKTDGMGTKLGAHKATKYFTNRGETEFLPAASHKSLLKCRVSHRVRYTMDFSKTSFMSCFIVLIKYSFWQRVSVQSKTQAATLW